VYQNTNYIFMKHLIEYNSTENNIDISLDDEPHYFFC